VAWVERACLVVQRYLPDFRQLYLYLVEHEAVLKVLKVLMVDVVVVLAGIHHQEALEPLEETVALEVPLNLYQVAEEVLEVTEPILVGL
jgi:hypothetical protein